MNGLGGRLTGKYFIMEINGNKLAEAAGPTGQITSHHPPYALVFLIKKVYIFFFHKDNV
jgi:hypothetical protein